MSEPLESNHLINSTSPYLLQHAHNPVEWYPWGEEALNKAKEEDKVILVSIGYSSCHWCHVMERESFENDSIAAIMNQHFVNIKVDREERPDIDQIYMDAVQTMGINGGWPLNVFLTPDQKPFYGGTYFPPERWARLLESIARSFEEKREDIEKAADGFVNSLNRSDVDRLRLEFDVSPFDVDTLEQAIEKLSSKFDKENGGFNRAPKFPLPSDWLFLLEYAMITGDSDALEHVHFTLDKMAMGGIYDQLGGGFARYSVDGRWFAPHFEKMLYDNGQLLTLYSRAFKSSGNESFKEVVYQTVEWLKNEMLNAEGGFYSALDADSEGEEGKFYVWKAEQLRELTGEDFEWYGDFYNVKSGGNWENGNNILHKSQSASSFAGNRNIDPAEFDKKLKEWNRTLLNIRNNRIRPGLDDKVLTGWNAMVITGLVEAYKAFGDESFLDLATRNGDFIRQNQLKDGQLLRTYKDGQSRINAYLEDYAFTIRAFISLYEATFDEEWLREAGKLTEAVISNFYDDSEKLFFYTSEHSEKLIARKKELFDNVIPSSNSQMAINLHLLGLILDKKEYTQLSEDMLRQVTQLVKQEPSYMSHWASLYLMKSNPTAEIVIVGPEYKEFASDISYRYIPNSIVMATEVESSLPLFEGRSARKGETTVYVCYNKACKLPVTTVADAIKQLE